MWGERDERVTQLGGGSRGGSGHEENWDHRNDDDEEEILFSRSGLVYSKIRSVYRESPARRTCSLLELRFQNCHKSRNREKKGNREIDMRVMELKWPMIQEMPGKEMCSPCNRIPRPFATPTPTSVFHSM